VPFTVSHAAAVLPLKKSRLPLAAMMIGSMSPDFAYFLPVSLARSSTHDLDGILFFCWPVSLAVWLLYVHLLERPTIELLPEGWRTRVEPSSRRVTARSLAVASIAVIVGAITHVIWDAFTHANTFVTNTFPFMTTVVFEYHGRGIRVFFLLQVLSSIVGLFALWRWALALRRGPARVHSARATSGSITDRTRIYAALSLVATSGLVVLGFIGSAGIPIEGRVFHMLIGGMTGWLLAWCAIAVFIGRTARHRLTREKG
jgi:hypothetical protein